MSVVAIIAEQTIAKTPNITELIRGKHSLPLEEGWRMIIDPRRYRMELPILNKAKILCVLTEILAVISAEKVMLLALFFSGVLDNSIGEHLSQEEAPLITVLLGDIINAFRQFKGYDVEPSTALAVLDTIYQHIDDVEYIMQTFNFTDSQACALIDYCKVLSPEDKL